MTRIAKTISVLFCAGGLLAQAVTEVEPNDTPGQANAINCAEHVEASVGFTGDLDWYTFTLAAPARVLLMTGTNRAGTVFDNVMELRQSVPPYDLIARNDDEDRSWMAAVSEYLPAGTYLVRVSGFGNGTGEYSLDLQCDPGGTPTTRVAEAPEPNGPLGAGTPTMIAVGEVGDGALAAADSDWWQFSLSNPTMVRIETGLGLTGTTSNDTTLRLRDDVGNELVFDDDDAPGNWSLIVATLQPGTYYADVQGFAGANAGTYTILLQGVDATATLPEAAEPNGDPLLGGSPSILACGVLGGGEILAADSDWWEFTLLTDSFVDLTLWGGAVTTTATPLDNSVLRLYDASSTQLAEDNDDFYDRDARLSVWLEAGTYYAEVVGNGANVGTYTVRLTCDEQALYHTFAGGCVGSNGLAPQWNVREWELPLTGTTLVGEFTNCPANGAVFAFLGFSRTISSGGIPLPVDLQVLGAPGCLVEVDPAGLLLLLADAAGQATWAFQLPQNATLAGLVFAQQAFVFDLPANALGLTTSNAGHGVISTVR